MVVGPHHAIPEFIAISLRIGPLMTVMVANELVLLDLAEMPLGRAREYREVLGSRARHDGVDRHLLYGEFPVLANAVGRSRPTILSGG